MHGSRSKIPSKKSCPYIYDVKYLALVGAPYIYDIIRLRVKSMEASKCIFQFTENIPALQLQAGS
jgi:hypothetical protein